MQNLSHPRCTVTHARTPPARALKAGDEQTLFHRTASWLPGVFLLATGIAVAWFGPVGGLPVFGYASIACLLVGAILLVPWLAALMFRHLPLPAHPPLRLALSQLRAAPGQAAVSLAAIVASFSLMAAMAIMVASFRQSVDDWLESVLPAELYFRTTHAGDTGHLAPGFEERVRALLAKAESTEFPQEAEALTARAQEMMARHSIDLALVAEDPEEPEAAAARRLPVDSPYDEHRAVLLNEVAEANHCRAVWHRELGLSTVMGFPGDVEAVDLLYTSLLVQAEAAMRVSGSKRDRSGRGARRDFRASFMSAFAVRVGERLTESARAAEEAATAETGTDLVPVFAARERAVEAAVDEAFGALTTSRVRGPSSAEGWYEGRAAADAASLGARTRLA